MFLRGKSRRPTVFVVITSFFLIITVRVVLGVGYGDEGGVTQDAPLSTVGFNLWTAACTGTLELRVNCYEDTEEFNIKS